MWVLCFHEQQFSFLLPGVTDNVEYSRIIWGTTDGDLRLCPSFSRAVRTTFNKNSHIRTSVLITTSSVIFVYRVQPALPLVKFPKSPGQRFVSNVPRLRALLLRTTYANLISSVTQTTTQFRVRYINPIRDA